MHIIAILQNVNNSTIQKIKLVDKNNKNGLEDDDGFIYTYCCGFFKAGTVYNCNWGQINLNDTKISIEVLMKMKVMPTPTHSCFAMIHTGPYGLLPAPCTQMNTIATDKITFIYCNHTNVTIARDYDQVHIRTVCSVHFRSFEWEQSSREVSTSGLNACLPVCLENSKHKYMKS